MTMNTTDPCSRQRRPRRLPLRAVILALAASYAAASCGSTADEGDSITEDQLPSRPVAVAGRDGSGGSAMAGGGAAGASGADGGGGAAGAGIGGSGIGGSGFEGDDDDVDLDDPPPRAG